MLARLAKRSASALLALVLLALSPSRKVRGVRVRIYDLRLDADDAFSRMDDALSSLDDAASRRFRWIRSNVNYIAVVPGFNSSIDNFSGLTLGASSLMRRSAEEVAGILVHEATHLRIKKAGIAYLGPWRERIERICARQEIELLEETSGEYSRARIAEIEKSFEEPWWTDDRITENTRRMIDDLALPPWLRRWLIRPR